MALSPALWIRRNLSMYIDNPSAVRDFRSQLRGYKAFLLWGFYLLILMAIALTAYSSIQGSSSEYFGGGYTRSISQAQEQLRQFYMTVSMLLAVMVCVITPAMTASAITSERQKRSLDLVFSAPVEPKKLLIGKMISSFRYTWMLLILSLPVTAVCVVMGGATWTDVLSLYALLSFSAVVFTAIGLLMSSLCRSTAAAICWSYLIVIAYLVFTGVLGSITAASGMSGFANNEAPWIYAMFPFAAIYAAPTHSVIYGHDVPNWVLAGLASLAISKILLLGAASHLSPFGSRDTISLRIHGLIYTALVSALISSAIAAFPLFALMGSSSFSRSVPPPYLGVELGVCVAWICALLLIFVPAISCYGWDGGRRYKNDGKYSIKNAFIGTPSGAMAYLVMLAASIIAGSVAGYMLKGKTPTELSVEGAVWGAFYLLFWWSLCRWLSARAGNLKGARTGSVAAMILLLGIPIPVLSILQASATSAGMESHLFQYQLLYPLFGSDGIVNSLVYTFVIALVGSLLLFFEATRKPPRHVLKAHHE